MERLKGKNTSAVWIAFMKNKQNNKTNPNCTAKGIIRYEIIEKIVDEINKEIQTV